MKKTDNLSIFSDMEISVNANTAIYLIGYYKSCAEELCKSYDVLDNIKGVIDDNLYKNYRSVVIGNHVIDVLEKRYIESLSGEEILIILGGDYKVRYEKLVSSKPIISKCRMYFFPGLEGRYMHSVIQKYKEKELKDIIIFRSGVVANVKHNDWEYADNARALFEYMLKENYDEKYKLVWMARNPHKYIRKIKSIKSHPNVEFIAYDDALSPDSKVRDNYFLNLCFAKYVFFCQSYMFARNLRENQVRVQLWHGCGFKSNCSANSEESVRYEYMTVTSDMYAKLHANSFGLKDNQMLITGLPKNDWIFNPIKNWQEILRVPKSSKYVFWLPTYRTKTYLDAVLTETMLNQETGLPIIKSESMMSRFNDLLKAIGITLVIKLHPSQDKTDVMEINFSNIVLLDNCTFIRHLVDINEILGCADALISDYSSVATGYMLLDRPIAFTLDDYEIYHGFHWPKEELRNWLPGEEIFDFDDFVRFVRDVADGKDTSREKRHRLMPYFHKYADGNSCARVLEALGITKD